MFSVRRPIDVVVLNDWVADVMLTAGQSRCRHLTTTEVLTANCNMVVPNNWVGIVFCINTGAFTTTF